MKYTMTIDPVTFLVVFNRCGCHESGATMGVESTHGFSLIGKRSLVECGKCKATWMVEADCPRVE